MTFEPSDRLIELAATGMAPEALREPARRARFGPLEHQSIAPGQLWRARQDDTVVFLLVLALPEPPDPSVVVRAAPVTVDPPGEDEACLVLDAMSNAFGVDATVWNALASWVPIRVLDDILDQVDVDLVTACLTLADHRELPTTPIPGARRGRVVDSLFDAAADVRAQTEDDLAQLLQAPGLPIAEQQDRSEPARLRLSIAQVRDALGVSQPVAMQVLRGKFPLDVSQAEKLAPLAGVSTETVLNTVQPLPAEVVEAVEHPQSRSRIRRLAAAKRISESRMRLQAAYAVYALAARETGGSGAWQSRLDRWLQAQLDQTSGDTDGRSR